MTLEASITIMATLKDYNNIMIVIDAYGVVNYAPRVKPQMGALL
jgi:hypothetical protein